MNTANIHEATAGKQANSAALSPSHRVRIMRRRSFPLSVLLAGMAVFIGLAIALSPAPVFAQDEADIFTPAEMCEQMTDIFPTLDENEREIAERIAELDAEFERLQALAERFQGYINPYATTGDSNYANVMFWLTMLKMQGVKNELALKKAHLEQLEFERGLFTQISEAFACEEEVETEPELSDLQSNCTLTAGTAIRLDRLDISTFVAVEDPDPAQEGQRWIEFRMALTNDETNRDPSVWLNRLLDWSKMKQEEGWTEVVRGSIGQFCNAIAASCIVPPSDDTFYALCGGQE